MILSLGCSPFKSAGQAGRLKSISAQKELVDYPPRAFPSVYAVDIPVDIAI